jgi:S-(hydroxymethyl)glutathione dehydrogenase / alcohol dehydrogenase
VRDLVGGADYAFEALGREETIQQAWGSLDIRGQLLLVGLLPGGARLTLDTVPFLSEQSVQGCYFGSADISRDVPALVDHYLRGDLVLDELISRRITLDELDDAVDVTGGEQDWDMATWQRTSTNASSMSCSRTSCTWAVCGARCT